MKANDREYAYKLYWAFNEVKSNKYKSEILFDDSISIMEFRSELMNTKCDVQVKNDRAREYKVTIQAPNVIINLASTNINDIISTMDRYMKGWRK